MSHTKDNGGPAFPTYGLTCDRSGHLTQVETYESGLSIRDWFAGVALQGLLAGPNNNGGDIIIKGERVPYDRAAYMFADALLKVRKM